MKIGLMAGAWTPNIGNAFFELGLKPIFQSIFPNAEFYIIGEASKWFFRQRSTKFSFNREKYCENALEIGGIANLDLLAFAGMSMCEEFVNCEGQSILKASRRGTSILGVGTGAALYTNQEADIFSNFISRLKKVALITRDDDSYDLFSNKIKIIEKGIDCAFFMPDYYTPPKLDLPPYDIVNFDGKCKIPPIKHSVDHIIYTHHDLWGPLKKIYMEKPNTLISDIPEDYLALYSQVHETHSNRVHACIATLAYGNKAKLYNNTPRKALFKKLNIDPVKNCCGLDMEFLEELKSRQIEKTKKILENILT
jgi:hypothetical protein